MVYLFPYAGDDRRLSVQLAAAKKQKAKPKVEKLKVDDDIVVAIPNHSSELMPVPIDRKSTRLNSSHIPLSRMPSSA